MQIKEHRKNEVIVTSIIAALGFYVMLHNFSDVMFGMGKCFVLEAWVPAIYELALFTFFIHMTIGYTVGRKLAWCLCLGLFLAKIGTASCRERV